MTTELQIFLCIGVAGYFIILFYLLKHRRFTLKYSLTWLLSGVIMLVALLFPDLILSLTRFVGIETPVNLVFVLCGMAVLLILLSVTAIITKLNRQIHRLVQTQALLEKRLRELEELQKKKVKKMELIDAVQKRRSIRRFRQEPVGECLLRRFVEGARLAPSGANLQPLKYKLVTQEEICRAVFPRVKWAAYLAPDGGPGPGEEPTAYIAVCVDNTIKKEADFAEIGSAVENILLLAEEAGVGACWLGSINRPALTRMLGIPEFCSLHTMIALGYPKQESVAEQIQNGDVRYYLDGEQRLHVPKRGLDEILL